MGRRGRGPDKSRLVKAGSSATTLNAPLGPIVAPMERADDDEDGAGTSWKAGLCGCCSDCDACCYGLFCPPCAVATAINRFDGSSWLLNCLCQSTCMARNIIREGYRIDGGCCADMCLSFLFYPCVVCQLLRETSVRGSIIDSWSRNSHRPVHKQPWRMSLCDCCDDLGNLAYATCMPCCAIGSVRTGFDGSDCLFNCVCLNSCIARSMIRHGYNVQGGACGDVATVCFCYPCAISQMLNEVNQRGRVDALDYAKEVEMPKR
jgi:Cys-rich protein (TIGR01571 family)